MVTTSPDINDSDQQAEPDIRLTSEQARQLMVDLFSKLGVPPQETDMVVAALMEASLAGYNSHGLRRVPMYAHGIQTGAMRPGVELQSLRETPASLYLDAGYGLGPVAATQAVRLAAEKATQSGIGCVSLARANDVARLGSYLIEPAQAGLIALMLVNDAGSGPCVAPWGGVQPFLSTNPIAAGIPWQADMPILIDISTSVVSLGKLKTLAAQGQSAPPGWLIDQAGELTPDVTAFFADPPGSALLPLGGMVAGYKGFALSLLVDVLAGALSGAGPSTGREDGLDRNGVFVIVIDPDMFVSRQQFNHSVAQLVAGLKNSTKIPGQTEILMPGERAYRERQHRLQHGIPLEAPDWRDIKAVLEAVGVEIPDA